VKSSWTFAKATGSVGDGSCVEIARHGDLLGVRDSKDPAGPVLVFSMTEWQSFLEAVKAGELYLGHGQHG